MDVLGDTPVRHDEFSITKTSLRSRVLITANNKKLTKERKVKLKSRTINTEKEVMSSLVNADSDVSMQSPLPADPPSAQAYFQDVTCHMSIDDSYSFGMPSIQTPSPSSQAHSQKTRSAAMSMGTPDIEVIKQQNSTPRPLKVPNKAVSSTPNLDNGNFSKLARNASTQTDFTSNVNHFEELHDDLKSFCVPDDGYLRVIICDTMLSQNSKLGSPGDKCASNILPFQKTPVQSKPSTIRKMSLRSKTMICSAYEKSKPTSFKRFNSMEEKRLFSNTFSLMPQHKTPPLTEKSSVVHNPFEKNLHKRLGKTVFSPDVFSNVVSPSEESEYLRWTIEDISSINPVAIDEDFTLPSDDEDPEKEHKVQQEINRYFSETHVVLSPAEGETTSSFCEVKNDKFLQRAVASTPNKFCPPSPKKFVNAITQTALSLPETLPNNLEDSLRSHFKLLEVEDLNLSASNLRRKLFFHFEDEPPSPVRFENNSSPLFKWENGASPYGAVNKKERHFTPVGKEQLSSPEMSPVVCQQPTSKNESSLTCKKNLHLYFPGAEEEEDVIMDTTSLFLPSSQDTGYNTEPSWRQSTQISPAPAKPPHAHLLLASTPTQLKQQP